VIPIDRSRFYVEPESMPEQMPYWQRIGIAVEIALAPVGGFLLVFALRTILDRIA
jgi:hypothetical protein